MIVLINHVESYRLPVYFQFTSSVKRDAEASDFLFLKNYVV